MEEEKVTTQKWIKKHLGYCQDKRCTHFCHEWNQLKEGVGKKLLLSDSLESNEGRQALADSFYVTPEPKKGKKR